VFVVLRCTSGDVSFSWLLKIQSRLAKLGQLVGFARATSDGVLSATIWDVAVAPAWQVINLGMCLPICCKTSI